MSLIVDISIVRLFVSLNLSSPYKSKSRTVQKEIRIFFEVIQNGGSVCIMKMEVQEIVCCVFNVDLSKFNVFLKSYRNLWSHRWLKPNLSLVNIFVPNGSLLLKISLSTPLTDFNNALWIFYNYKSLQIFGSSFFHSLMTWGKRIFEVSSSTSQYIESVRVSERISHFWK